MKFLKRLQDGKIKIVKTYRKNVMIQFCNNLYKTAKKQDLFEILKKLNSYFSIFFIFPIYKLFFLNIREEIR